jgi:branched-chain amino acid transport system ATP-binding protein
MSEPSRPRPPVLEVEGLNAFYGKSQVVFDLELRVDAGETVAMLGRNGAGKTSTLFAIAGVVSHRAKTLRVGGKDIARLASFARVRRGLSVVPSGSRAFPNLSVEENLGIVRPGRNGTSWTIDDAYAMFPVLSELRGASAGTLSGGERQMLAVARAMLAGPKLLMLDEPSEGLAPMVLRGIAGRLREMNEEGIGVLLTEQNHRFALDTAHRAYFIEKGQIVWEGAAERAKDAEVIGRYMAV